MTVALVAETNMGNGAPGGTSPEVDTVGADLIVVAASQINPVAFADSLSNIYTPLVKKGGNASCYIQIAYCFKPTTGAAQTFTIAGSSSYTGAAIAAFSGVSGSSPVATILDINNGTSGVQPGSATPAFNDELIVTALCFAGSALSVNEGFTIAATQLSGANQLGASLAYLVQSTAAAVDPTWSGTSLSDQNTAMASFQTGVTYASDTAGLLPVLLGAR